MPTEIDFTNLSPLQLSDDQESQLRVLARRLRLDLAERAEALKRGSKDDWKERRDLRQAYAGMAEGVLLLASELLGDPELLDDPSNL